MKMILHLLRRELAHNRLLLIMLAVLLVVMTWLAISMESRTGSQMVFLIRYLVFQPFFLGVAGWLGWKDSEYRENHDLHTRPISSRELVAAKVIFIAGMSAMASLSQAIVNGVLGLEVSFLALVFTLTLAGLAVYFLTMTLRSSLGSPIRAALLGFAVIVIFSLYAEFGSKYWGFDVFEPTIFRVVVTSFAFGFGLFLIHRLFDRKILRFSVIALLVVACGTILGRIPYPDQKGDVALISKTNPSATSPEAELQVASGRLTLLAPPVDYYASALDQYYYTQERLVLTQPDGTSHSEPAALWRSPNHSTQSYFSEQFLKNSLSQLGEVSKEQAAWLERSLSGRSQFPNFWIGSMKLKDLPSDQVLEIHAEGLVQHHRFEKVGELPLQKGAVLNHPELRLEVVEPYLPSDEKRSYSRIILRGEALGDAGANLTFLISHPDQKECLAKNFQLNGDLPLSGVPNQRVRSFQLKDLPLSVDFLDGWTIKFFHWRYTGSVPFESKPVTYQPGESAGDQEKDIFAKPRPILSAAEREAYVGSPQIAEMDTDEVLSFLDLLPVLRNTGDYSYQAQNATYQEIARNHPEVLIDRVVQEDARGERPFGAINAINVMAPESLRDLITEKALTASELLSVLVTRGWIDGMEGKVFEIARKEASDLSEGTLNALRYFGTPEAKELLFQSYASNFNARTFDFLHRDPRFKERVFEEIRKHRAKILQSDYQRRRGLQKERQIKILVRSGDRKALAKVLSQSFDDNLRTQVLRDVLLNHDLTLFRQRGQQRTFPDPASLTYDSARAKFILPKS